MLSESDRAASPKTVVGSFRWLLSLGEVRVRVRVRVGVMFGILRTRVDCRKEL